MQDIKAKVCSANPEVNKKFENLKALIVHWVSDRFSGESDLCLSLLGGHPQQG